MNDNPIRFDRIDAGELATMELDYRQRIFSEDESSAFASQVFVIVFGIALAVALTVSLAGSWFTTQTGFIVASALGVALAGLALLRSYKRLRTAVICLIATPMIPTLLYGLSAALSSSLGRIMLLAVFVSLLGYMTDRMLTHAHEWLLAHPSFDAAERRKHKSAWRHRFFLPRANLSIDSTDDSWDQPSRIGFAKYFRQGLPAPYGLKLFACCATVFVLVALCQLSSTLALYLPLLLMALCIGASLYSFSQYSGGLHNGWLCTRHTLVHWLYFGKVVVDAPGLFQGSCGDFFTRLVRSLILLSGLSLSVLTITNYMPISRPLSYASDKHIFANYYNYYGRAVDEENAFLSDNGFKTMPRYRATKIRIPPWRTFFNGTMGNFTMRAPPSLETLVQETLASTLQRAKQTGDPTELIGFYRPLRDDEVDDWINAAYTRFCHDQPSRWLAISIIGVTNGQYLYLFVILALQRKVSSRR